MRGITRETQNALCLLARLFLQRPRGDRDIFESKKMGFVALGGPNRDRILRGGGLTAQQLQSTTVDGFYRPQRQPTLYKCTRCIKTYARLHSLSRHVRFECGVDPKFECPVCHKKSKHKHNLLLHMKTHHK
ncbi:Zinc finger C2H2-type [Cinara cedri]|uniref:Zinc finger C2H2-type n=1 Tax=Cinara cedri TaxID=506608 RepID=A0A5E4MBC6_9HEMI|nr:Zinc finger C2H2-type [Cinara cedri]